MANTNLPKSLYRTYLCSDPADPWSYQPSQVLHESDDLGDAHYYAWQEWQKDQSKSFTIIQPYDDSCRGFYGPQAENA